MEETSKFQNPVCKVCGKPVIDTGTGGVVHSGGAAMEQQCSNCGWSGGQIGKYKNCPRCGEGTQLTDDHIATL